MVAVVTIQRVRPFAEQQNSVLRGPITGNVYQCNGLGQAIIDALDQPSLLTDGWVMVPTSGPQGATGATGPPGPTGPIRSINIGTGLTPPGVTTGPDVSIAMATIPGVAGTYASPSSVVVNAEGQITSITGGSGTGGLSIGSPVTPTVHNELIYSDGVSTVQAAALGTGLSLSGGVLSVSGGVGLGSVTSVGTGTGLTGGPITTSGTIALANTAVTPGSYTNSNITVDAQGRLTAASSGTGGGGSPSGSSLNIIGTDQNVYANPGFAATGQINATYDTWIPDPVTSGFGNQDALDIQMTQHYGQNNYLGGTNAKTTSTALQVGGNFAGAGQHVLFGLRTNVWGMSDAFLFAYQMQYSTGPTSGDEGQGFSAACFCLQQNTLSYATIVNVPAQSTINTTTAGAITAKTSPQTIQVGSAAGASVNDWVVFNQSTCSGADNICAAQITAINTVGSVPTPNITCIVPNNFPSGTTVTPAMVLVLDNLQQFGQDRVLVRLCNNAGSDTAFRYNAGNLSQNGTGALIGDGTGGQTFTAAMVGGNAKNIGAVSFDADTYQGNGSSFPFWQAYSLPLAHNNQALRSWYQITSVGSATSIGIHSFSTAGDASYHGLAPVNPSFTGGTYVIKPAARILRLFANGIPNGNAVVCETVGTVWAVGDQVECAVCPYPDVHGFDYRIAQWNPGGIRRSMMHLWNSGSRMFEGALSITGGSGSAIASGGNADAFAYGFGVATDFCQTGWLHTVQPNGLYAAHIFEPNALATTDANSRVHWDTQRGQYYIGKSFANWGLQMQTAQMRDRMALVNFIAYNGFVPNNPYNIAKMEWEGFLRLSADAAAHTGTLGFGRDPFVEFGNRTDHGGPFGTRMQIASLLGNNNGPYTFPGVAGCGAVAQSIGIDIYYASGSSGLPTLAPLLSMGPASAYLTSQPFVTAPPQNSATSSNNYPSAVMALTASVWNSGAAAALRPAMIQMVPGSGVDPTDVLQIQFFDHGRASEADKVSFPITAFSVSDIGKVYFGFNNAFSSFGGVTMDPGQTTAPRTVTWPDASGGNLVVTTGTPPASQTAAGTAGELRVNTSNGNVYICYQTGGAGAGGWTKLAGSLTVP